MCVNGFAVVIFDFPNHRAPFDKQYCYGILRAARFFGLPSVRSLIQQGDTRIIMSANAASQDQSADSRASVLTDRILFFFSGPLQ